MLKFYPITKAIAEENRKKLEEVRGDILDVRMRR
jgi:hypothetical protein